MFYNRRYQKRQHCTRALRAGYIRTLSIRNPYCSSTAKMVAGQRLYFTLYVHFLYCFIVSGTTAELGPEDASFLRSLDLTQLHTHTHTYTYTHIHATHKHTHTYTYKHIHIHTHTRYTYRHTHTDTYTHARATHKHTHIHTHTRYT